MDWDVATKIVLSLIAAGGMSFGGIQTREKSGTEEFVKYLTVRLDICRGELTAQPTPAFYYDGAEYCDLELLDVCDRDYKSDAACVIGQCEAGCLIPAEYECP